MNKEKHAFARVCLDCGADISDRGSAAKRCKPCSDKRKRTQYQEWAKLNPELIKSYLKSPEKVKFHSSRRTESYTKCYVASLLKMPTPECPPELIEAKRDLLLAKRALKELTTTLKELTHEE